MRHHPRPLHARHPRRHSTRSGHHDRRPAREPCGPAAGLPRGGKEQSTMLPSNTSSATGQPSRSHSRPNSICNLVRLPSRVAALCQRAAVPVHIAGGQVLEHQSTFGQVLAGQAVLDPLLALAQPVHGGV